MSHYDDHLLVIFVAACTAGNTSPSRGNVAGFIDFYVVVLDSYLCSEGTIQAVLGFNNVMSSLIYHVAGSSDVPREEIRELPK